MTKAVEVPVEIFEQRGHPAVCVKTGEPADASFRQTFTYVPRWVLVLIFFGLLPFLIAYLATKKSVAADLPVTGHVRLMRSRLLWIRGFLIGLAIAAVVLGISYGPEWWYLAAAAAFGALYAGFDAFGYTVRGTLSPDERTLLLRGLHPEFVRSLRA